MLLKVFVDSDVVLSSLISPKGAAFFLLNQKSTRVKLFISNYSVKEQRIAAQKLKISQIKLLAFIKKTLTIIQLKLSFEQLKKKCSIYVTDANDTHIVAGAQKAKVNFLITYNQKHFFEDKIKKDLQIIILTPAQLLQYLRNQSYFA